MSADPDCLFCKIIAGDIPSDMVYRGDRVVAFRDINPVASVHILVVPVDHHTDVVQLVAKDEPLLAEVVTVAGELAKAEANGQFRLMFNTGAEAGQSVFHVHAHVLAGSKIGIPG
ncbi:histidine triad nucleotide-binding protein [Kineosporia succinea]|uniref:Histidine triad (HIT) family protein n=2 Tax=Kineosporia succinea TaxID=84632 RepID=A0ABT9P5M5_9ACTN|nr:HIT domain-containing protein [Kineosporia succinea]MDP9827982.1 histidine triad (HIT) family protein [Kineosporia succinea]